MFEYLDVIENVSPSHGKVSTLGDFVAVIFNAALGLGISIALLGVILSGIKYMSARGGGDSKALTTAKSALYHSILALILVFGAFTIYRIVLGFLGAGFGNGGGGGGANVEGGPSLLMQ